MSSIILFPQNILESGTFTVTDEDSAYPKERLHDRSKSFYWKDTGTIAREFHVDQGASSILDIDFLAISDHNFNGINMQWQYSTDDAAWSDAVTDWTQSDNDVIIKTIGSAQTKRYWKVTLASMANARATEIFMSLGYEFDVLAPIAPTQNKLINVQWNRMVGGLERSTKFGDERRRRRYAMKLSASDYTSWKTAIDYLDNFSKAFWFKDHEANYWMARFDDSPDEDFSHKTHVLVQFYVVEML